MLLAFLASHISDAVNPWESPGCLDFHAALEAATCMRMSILCSRSWPVRKMSGEESQVVSPGYTVVALLLLILLGVAS